MKVLNGLLISLVPAIAAGVFVLTLSPPLVTQAGIVGFSVFLQLIFSFVPSLNDVVRSRWMEKYWVTIAALVVIVLVIFGGVYLWQENHRWSASYDPPLPLTDRTKITVYHPADIGNDIWIIQQQENGKYFPKTLFLEPPPSCEYVIRPKSDITNHKFTLPLSLGVDASKTKAIIVGVADSEASREIGETLRAWCVAGPEHFVGMPHLPPGFETKIESIFQ